MFDCWVVVFVCVDFFQEHKTINQGHKMIFPQAQVMMARGGTVYQMMYDARANIAIPLHRCLFSPYSLQQVPILLVTQLRGSWGGIDCFVWHWKMVTCATVSLLVAAWWRPNQRTFGGDGGARHQSKIFYIWLCGNFKSVLLARTVSGGITSSIFSHEVECGWSGGGSIGDFLTFSLNWLVIYCCIL